MNICDLLFSAADEVKELIDFRKRLGYTEEEAVDQIVDEVIAQTKKESDEGIIHGICEEIL